MDKEKGATPTTEGVAHVQHGLNSTPETSARSTALSQRHANLDAQIDAERLKVSPDDMLIQSLKKQKLAIKDQLLH